jgi:acetyl-CoA carboxylase biotin carboxyl carrier protein
MTAVDPFPDLDVAGSRLEDRLRSLREEAGLLVRALPGPVRHIALKAGDCMVEVTWSEPADHPAGTSVPVATAPAPVAGTEPEPAGGPSTATVKAPLVGVFYRAPAPGAKPFVEPGDRVEANQTVGIIEAMKLMNHITTHVAGVVTEVVVADGQSVEFDQELVRIAAGAEPDGTA